MSGRAIFLAGNDAYHIAERAKAVVEELLPGGASDVGLEVINGRVDSAASGPVVSACLAALQSMSLFGSNRVVWLRDAAFLSEKGGGGDGADGEGGGDPAKSSGAKAGLTALAALVKAGLPDDLAFIVTAESVDRRSAFFKAFDSKGEVEQHVISEKPWEAAKQARGFVNERLRDSGLKASEDAIEVLLARAGADTQALAGEIDKLALYAGGGPVTARDAMLMVTPSREAVVWELTDAIGSRDKGTAFAVMKQLLFQGESAMAIIAAIEGYFRQLAVARDVLDRGWARVSGRELVWRSLGETETAVLDAAAKMDLRKMHPFRAFKVAEQASRRTAANIRRCRIAAVSAHEGLVSSRLPESLAMDFLLCQLLA